MRSLGEGVLRSGVSKPVLVNWTEFREEAAMMNRTLFHSKRLPLAAATVYAGLVVVALIVTLRSLSKDDFDGLNNLLQIPLALPWWVIVPAPTNHKVDAFVTAGLGLLNSGLLYVLLRRILGSRPSS